MTHPVEFANYRISRLENKVDSLLAVCERLETYEENFRLQEEILTFVAALSLYATSPGDFIKPERQRAVRERITAWLHGGKRGKVVTDYVKQKEGTTDS